MNRHANACLALERRFHFHTLKNAPIQAEALGAGSHRFGALIGHLCLLNAPTVLLNSCRKLMDRQTSTR